MQIIPPPDPNLNATAVDSALLQSTYSDIDPEKALVESRAALGAGTSEHIKAVQGEARNAGLDAAIEFVAEARGTDQDLALEVGAAELAARHAQEPDGNRSTFGAQALAAVSAVDFESTDAAVKDDELARTVAEAWEQQGIGGFVADFFGVMFIPDTVKDEGDVAEAALGEGARDLYRGMQDAWRMLPQEKQDEMFPSLSRLFLDENDGNVLKAQDRLSAFLEGDHRNFDKIVDASLIGEYLVAPLKIARGLNAVRKVAKVGAESEAASLAIAGAKSEEAAEVLGMSTEDAIDTILPLDTSVVNPNAVQGLNAAVQRQADRVQRDLQRARDIALLKSEQLRPGFATPAEQRAFRESFDTSESITPEAQDLIDELSFESGNEILDFDILKVTDSEFTVRATVRAEDGTTFAVRQSRPLLNKHLGKLDGDAVVGDDLLSTWRTKVNSPSAFIPRIDKSSAVNEAEQLDNQSARIIESFVEPLKRLMSTGKKRDTSSTLHVLQEGDFEGKIFTDEEVYLRASAMGADPEKVLEAYRIGRDTADTMFVISNNAARGKMLQQGFKATKVKVQTVNKRTGELTEAIQDVFIKPKDPDPGTQMYIPDLEEIITSGTPRYDELVESGYVPHRSSRSVRVQDEAFDRLLLPPGSVRQLPHEVLNREPGYWPRVYSDSTRFVRVRASNVRNGVEVKDGSGFVNVAFAKSSKAAHAWVRSAKGQAVLRAQGLTDDQIKALRPENIVITKDQGAAEEGVDASAEIFGGLAYSPRSSRKMYDIDGAGKIDPVESLERAIRKVADSSAMGAWLDKKRAKWLKTARPYMEDPSADFLTARLDDRKAPTGSTQRNSLESYRQWLNDVARVPSTGEREVAALVDRFADSVAGSKLLSKLYPKGLSEHVYKFGTEHPADRLRSASFHLMLGMFNPAQLLVQASQAAVAFSINPRGFKQVMHKGMALRHAMHIVRRGAESEELAKIAKAWGVKPDDFEVMARTFDKAGILQGIKANADLSGALQGTALNSGMMSRVFEKGLLPFYEGELFSRGYAYISAGEEFVRKNKKTWATLTDDEIKEIVARSRRDTFQLHRVNRAAWQRGFLGVPTQFWQIWMKALENMLPGRIGTGSSKLQKFSTQERSRMFTGQLMLYGAGGVPLATTILDNMMSGMAVGTFEGGHPPPEVQAGMQQGMIGLVQQAMFGEQVTTSKRMGILSGMEDQWNFFVNQEETLVAKVAGPMGSIYERVGSGMAVLVPLAQSKLSDEQDLSMTASDWRIALEAVASPASSTSNAFKAWTLHRTGLMHTKSGRVIGDIVGEDFRSKMFLTLAQAAGFSPLLREEMHSLEQFGRESSETRKIASDLIINLQNSYLESVDRGQELSEANSRSLVAQTQIILGGLPTDAERRKVWTSVQEGMSRGRPEEIRRRIGQQYYDAQALKGEGSVAKSSNRQLNDLPATHAGVKEQ